jgi:putative tryptophan/tyrosine transport system substrate-binding protein
MLIARLLGFSLVLFLTASFVAHAQPRAKVARLAVVLFDASATNPNLAAFVAGLRDLGYVEGRNVAFEYRHAGGRPELVPGLGLQAASLKPDVIVVLGGDMVPAVKAATTTLPIVMLTSNDPVEAGVITSFARPGGNITGVAFVSEETASKRLQFLKQAVPSLTRVAVLWHPDHPDGEYRSAEAAGRLLGIQVQSLEVRRLADFGGAFETAIHGRAQALMVVSSRFMNLNRGRILEFAHKHQLPVVTGWGPWAHAGGLMSYGPDLDVLARRSASHVDKILKGARPADLPVEQPTKFELVINLRTAKALGLAIHQSLLAHADQIIE